MKYREWLPELARRVKDDIIFAKNDQAASRHAERMRENLTPKQMKIVQDYLACIESMAMVRMIYAHNLGLEQGREGKR